MRSTRAGSAKRYGVRRLSVPASAHNSKPAAAGLLLWARRAGDIDRLLQQRRANAGSATLSAYIVAEHRLTSEHRLVAVS